MLNLLHEEITFSRAYVCVQCEIGKSMDASGRPVLMFGILIGGFEGVS